MFLRRDSENEFLSAFANLPCFIGFGATHQMGSRSVFVVFIEQSVSITMAFGQMKMNELKEQSARAFQKVIND